jgi:hypothetical protein
MSEQDEASIASAIEDAEELKNPLDDLLTRAASDPGAAFRPEVLRELASLRQHNRAEFETIRAQLKRAGVRVFELDRAMFRFEDEPSRHEPAQDGLLHDLAHEMELFHAPDGTPFADIGVKGHRETWRIDGEGFKHWLYSRHYEQKSSLLRPETYRSIVDLWSAEARYRSPVREVYVRVASSDDRIFIDLADDEWRAVEIGREGYRVIKNPPVRFYRTPGMEALPLPGPGTIEDLLPFLNLATEESFVLVVAWLLAALRHPGPYPVLTICGEHGTAKSDCASILRQLIDPNGSPLRAPPREERDLIVAAKNAHVLAFDNLTTLPAWLSNALCRISTGGGYAARRLFTDDSELLFKGQRPVILNSIENVVVREDLADRDIRIELERIPSDRRMTERELWSRFQEKRSGIFGALCGIMAHGLQVLPDIRPKELPRMADFTVWAMACERALWPRGTVQRAYQRNRQEMIDRSIEADPIALGIIKLMDERTLRTLRTPNLLGKPADVVEWEGTASALLNELTSRVEERVSRNKEFPRSPDAIGNRLRRSAPILRERGVEVTFSRQVSRDRTRMIRLSVQEDWWLERASEESEVSAADSLPEAEDCEKAEVEIAREKAEATPVQPSPTVEAAKTNGQGSVSEPLSPSASEEASRTEVITSRRTKVVMGPNGKRVVVLLRPSQSGF